MFKFRILSLPLILLCFVCCAGNGSSAGSKQQSSSLSNSLDIIESISDMRQYKVGDTIKIELTLKQAQQADSIILIIDNASYRLIDNKYSFVSDESMPLGNHTFSLEAYKNGQNQTRMSSYVLLPTHEPVRYGYKIEQSYPHNEFHYTQGLIFAQGTLYEGTGIKGESILAQVDLLSGKRVRSINLDDKYFGEGITLLDGKIYQLTWQEGKAFVYDVNSFKTLEEFDYQGEGWGLTTDGKLLYMSNGSHKITVRNPDDFSILRTIEVYNPSGGLNYLNELEWIEGEIWANIYTTDLVVRIDPATGLVLGYVDFADLLDDKSLTERSEVLNGIAYDPVSQSIYVTGKYWNKMFKVNIYQK